uniref:Transmembrane protein 45B-like n=1 Tax=Sinocyclocheilus rhinocerous TaxID=307959 RepID=A0A673N2H0_9TELE
MGSFKGHALPGSFFLITGLWWAAKQTFLYATRRNKSAGAGRLASRATQRHIEIIEGAVILSFSIIGMLAEQLLAGGPKFQLYDSSTQNWEQLMNWQHTTMYLFFAIAGAISLTVHSTDIAPLALDRMLLGLAFFNEGFLFLYHLHGRDMLDVHVHTLLLYAIFGQAFICLLEVFHRGNLLTSVAYINVQIGFVLYPPSQVKWDQTDHDNLVFVTLCYCWHLAFALLTVAVVYWSVLCAVRSRLRRMPPIEMGLLKPREKEVESEDEIL